MAIRVLIPRRMARLPLDPRGYPIPVGVLRTERRAHFTINDEEVRQDLLARDLCPICGQLLQRWRWFVGGPRSALDPHGAYIDPPMHDECAHYALKVCPYLAAPHYDRRIDGATLSPEERADPRLWVLADDTQIPDRPDAFVAVLTSGQLRTANDYLIPLRPYRRIEVWQHGELLKDAEGRAVIEQIMQQPAPPARRGRRLIQR